MVVLWHGKFQHFFHRCRRKLVLETELEMTTMKMLRPASFFQR